MTIIRRVAVFGGSGFIGRYVVQRLARRDCRVVVIGRRASQAGYLQPMGGVGQIVPLDLDIANEPAVHAATAGCEAVVNLIGLLAESGRQRFDSLHVEAAGRIARIAKEARVERLVHLSALGADAQSKSVYARTKAEGEAALRAAFPEATVLRPSVVFGPEDKFFNKFAAMAASAPFLPLVGGGRTRFQPVYVGDVADAVLASLDREEARGATYELGGPRIYSFRELMELTLIETNRRRRLTGISFDLATFVSAFLQHLPGAPLTPDQVQLLHKDSIVTAGARTLRDLGIEPTAAELILPTYLNRYRRGGWFTTRRMA